MKSPRDVDLFIDIKNTLVLLLTFMKKYKLFYFLYGSEGYEKFPKLSDPTPKYGYGNGSICELWLLLSSLFGSCFLLDDRLVLSQLWRFFLLDNIDSLGFVSEDAKNEFIEYAKYIIQLNGIRQDSRVADYFKKYSMSPTKDYIIIK
jgi:hypothetical protein